jgi:hypothetical protein
MCMHVYMYISGKTDPHQCHAFPINFHTLVDRNTGGQFEDSKLEELAIALLNAASSPLNVISNKGALGAPPAPAKDPVPIDPARQVTIIPSSNS